MNKRMILFLVLATTIMLMPAVSIKAPQKKVSCFIRATFDAVTWEWQGYIVFPGEPASVYNITWEADTNPRFVCHNATVFPKHLEKFEETWKIDNGTIILANGTDRGTFSEDSWEFWMNGDVEMATADLVYLANAKVHIRGIAWIDLDGNFQLIGEMSFTGYGK